MPKGQASRRERAAALKLNITDCGIDNLTPGDDRDLVAAGLRLSMENEVIRNENARLKRKLSETATCCCGRHTPHVLERTQSG